MPNIDPPTVPSACAQCQALLQLAHPGAVPMPSAYSLVRSMDGKLRIDYGNFSVISNPAAALTIALDHLKLEARIIPMPPRIPQMPQLPGVPQMPALPAVPADIEELGTRLIDGVEAVGRKFTFQPPPVPAIPQLPPRPNIPQILEVWTSPTLHLSVLTKMTGSFGVHTNSCKIAVAAEPPAASFQIPAGYNVVQAPALPNPTIPAPAIPTPKLPKFGR